MIQPHIKLINRRIYTGVAERITPRLDSGHWFKQLSIDDQAIWLESNVHWSIETPMLLEKLNK